MKIIYDIGANKGDNIPYYLKKADKVIAIEPDPNLAKLIYLRFFEHVVSGKLIIENCVVTVEEDGIVPFYLGKNPDGSFGNVHNTMMQPSPSEAVNFAKADLPARNILKILNQHGPAYFMKIDIEHYDHVLLKYLFQNNIKPPLLSCEAHTVEVFCLMVTLGDYRSFKLVDGHSVSEKYNNHQIATNNGIERYSFPYHSAGPFGDDINGNWINMNNFGKILPLSIGWKDIHVSNIDMPDDNLAPEPLYTVSVQLPQM